MSALFDRRLSDESLGRRLAQGEAPAFDELYRRYAHRLAAYGTHLLGDASAGDDVAQVALMRAYQSLREGRVPEALGAWLYRIAHNAAIDAVRTRREWPTEFLPERGREQRGGEVGALTAAIAALPERQRKAFVLRELHGLRIGETAAELGLSNAQVEQALFAARNRLAEQLVFGERLSCSAVQRLAAGPLNGRERRALKTHVRSCPSCRKQLGLRGVALSLPLPPFGWLRSGLGAGGVPAAAKIAAVVAVAAVATGIPLAGLHPQHGLVAIPAAEAAGPDTPLQHGVTMLSLDPAVVVRPVHRHVVATRPAASPAQPAAQTQTQPPVVAARTAPSATPARHETHHATRDKGSGSRGPSKATSGGGMTLANRSVGDGPGDGLAVTTPTTPATTTTVTTTGSSGDGSGDSSGRDGSSDDGHGGSGN